MNINLDFAESVFADCVKEQATLKEVSPETIALVLHPLAEYLPKSNTTAWVLRVNIISKVGDFETETKELKDITLYDAGRHISRAILEVFNFEIKEHNRLITAGENLETHETTQNYNKLIDRDKIECYVEVDKTDTLKMNIIYDHQLLKKYSLKEEFAGIN